MLVDPAAVKVISMELEHFIAYKLQPAKKGDPISCDSDMHNEISDRDHAKVRLPENAIAYCFYSNAKVTVETEGVRYEIDSDADWQSDPRHALNASPWFFPGATALPLAEIPEGVLGSYTAKEGDHFLRTRLGTQCFLCEANVQIL